MKYFVNVTILNTELVKSKFETSCVVEQEVLTDGGVSVYLFTSDRPFYVDVTTYFNCFNYPVEMNRVMAFSEKCYDNTEVSGELYLGYAEDMQNIAEKLYLKSRDQWAAGVLDGLYLTPSLKNMRAEYYDGHDEATFLLQSIDGRNRVKFA